MKKIVKVKSSLGCLGKNIGCEKASEAILGNVDKELLKNYDIIEVEIVDDDFVKTVENIEKVDGDIFIGGDHSITYPIFKNFKKNNIGGKIGLIIFDAHPDCVNNFSPPTHEDFVKTLILEKQIDKKDVFLIGLRNIDDIEKKFIKNNNIKNIMMNEVDGNLTNRLINFIDNYDTIYFSIDIDCLDSEFTPGTGYPEKDGFNIDNLIRILKEVNELGKVGRIDLVEVNPLKDKDEITVNSAVKLLEIFL